MLWLALEFFGGGPASGAGCLDSGTVGGVGALDRPRHHPKMQMLFGNGFETRCFFFDCSLCISATMSSTGRSAGHEGAEDCASIAALKTAKVSAQWTFTRQLYRYRVNLRDCWKHALA